MRALPACAVLILFAAVAAVGCTATSGAAPRANVTPMPSVSAGTGSATPLSSRDTAFLGGAANAAQFEIEGGKLASSRATDQRVRQFGSRMVRDHEQGYQRLRALGQQLGVTVSAALTSQQRDILRIWSSLRGGPFSCSYTPVQYLGHAGVVAAFESEARLGGNQRIRDFATSELPTLQGHLDMASQNLTRLNCAAA
ncbi:MAG: putative rane protein [Micromonosporaceae bacterium]|jgi:putative membrane protein